MNDTTSLGTQKQVAGIPDVYACDLTLTISRAQSNYRWLGPKISREVWSQILAFFEWTQATAHSESQVRLFVNGQTKEWKAWAFPQKRGTGMHTDELPDHPDWPAQQAENFPDPWVYYGTVHHHCSMSAFQSGTDEHNERLQDGIHITIGKVGSAVYDFDARLYQNSGGIGWKIPLDMSEFWDIGDYVRACVPSAHHDSVARFQMCRKVAAEATFPDKWKENYITPPPVVLPPTSTNGAGGGTVHGVYTPPSVYSGRRFPHDTNYDRRDAAKELYDWIKENKPMAADYNFDEKGDPELIAQEILDLLSASPYCTEICRLLWQKDLSPKVLADAFAEHCATEELEDVQGKKEKDKMANEGGVTGGVSMPDKPGMPDEQDEAWEKWRGIS